MLGDKSALRIATFARTGDGIRFAKGGAGEVLSGRPADPPSQGSALPSPAAEYRPLNTYTDGDDTVRPRAADICGQRRAGARMALEWRRRALNAAPEFAPERIVALAGYKIPVKVQTR